MQYYEEELFRAAELGLQAACSKRDLDEHFSATVIDNLVGQVVFQFRQLVAQKQESVDFEYVVRKPIVKQIEIDDDELMDEIDELKLAFSEKPTKTVDVIVGWSEEAVTQNKTVWINQPEEEIPHNIRANEYWRKYRYELPPRHI